MTPKQIIAALRESTQANPVSVTLFAGDGFTVEAGKNPFANGFALVVVHDGKRYNVEGFKTRPSEAALAIAVHRCKTYASNLPPVDKPKSITILLHEDKRMIEFKRELFYDGKLVETTFPKRCGLACSGGTMESYVKGCDYHVDRKKHPTFDFELWCWNTFGDKHRDNEDLGITINHAGLP